MKKILVVLVSLVWGGVVSAQESVLTNSWYDNTSVQVSVGAQILISEGALSTGRVTPSFDLSLAKWFTPNWGARVGFQGFTLEENYTPYCWNHYQVKTNADGNVCYYNQSYLHLDIMASATNFLGGYNDRRFNIAPYAHFGYLRLSHPDYSYFTSEYRDREIVAGFGMIVSVKVGKQSSVLMDYRNTYISGRFHDNHSDATIVANHMLSVGYSYAFSRREWTKTSALITSRDEAYAALEEAERKAKEATSRLIDECVRVDSLSRVISTYQVVHDEETNEVVEVPKTPERSEVVDRILASDLILYFDLNKSVLSLSEVLRLKAFVAETLEEDPYHVFYVTGSADESTGTAASNNILAKNRALEVKKFLVTKMDVPESQVVLKSVLVSAEHEDVRFDRYVLLEDK